MKKFVFAGLLVAMTVVSMMATTVSAVEPETVKEPEAYSVAVDTDNFDEDIVNDSSVASTEIDIETIVSDISDAIAEYYYSKDISGIFVADNIFKPEIASYLSDKIDTQQYVTKLYNTDKENYNVDVSLKTYTEMSEPDILSFEFQVVTTYNYVGCSFETSSSELVKVLYDCTTNEIIDLYTPMNYYDEFVRGDQSVTGISSAVEGFDLTSSVIAKQNEIIEQIDSR